MNSPTPSSAEYHSQMLLLLPWYVNKSLGPDEYRQVEKHLGSCLICRREMLALRKLAAAVKETGDLDLAAEASLSAVKARLQHSGSGLHPTVSNNYSTSTARWRQPRRRLPGVKGPWLAAAASVLLASLPLLMHFQYAPTGADYYTLSANKPETKAEGQLRVVFSNALTDSGIDNILGQIPAQRIDGPNSIGAYTVELLPGADARHLADALALLRKRQDVILAEPILQP